MIRPLCLALALLGAAHAASAERLRLAYWNTELTRKGPGELLRDLTRAEMPDIRAAVQTLDQLQADVVVLSGFDFDAGGLTLAALNALLAAPYAHQMALRPNAGVATGFDLDQNGVLGEARDSMGFGWYPGQAGMAILSRQPFDTVASRDFTSFLWKDLPGAHLPPLPAGADEILRLSSVSHADTVIRLPTGQSLSLLTWHATTPAFDGPEDRNGLRNADENRFWTLLLDGALPHAAPTGPYILIGQANVDPVKGDGIKEPIQSLLADPRLQNPLEGDTVDYGKGIGPLRVAYILPSAALNVVARGVLHPDTPSRHWPIWVDIDF